MDDHDDLFVAFSRIVGAGEGFPQSAPVTRDEFDDYWVAHSSAISVARFGSYLIGAYYIKPNFVGRAAHIANAGYFVLAAYRGTGVGRSLVEHSMLRGAPARLRRPAVQPRLRVQPGPLDVRAPRLQRDRPRAQGRRR